MEFEPYRTVSTKASTAVDLDTEAERDGRIPYREIKQYERGNIKSYL